MPNPTCALVTLWFQFLLVRLKVFFLMSGGWWWSLFQFLLVRLKVQEKGLTIAHQHISIPTGTIKRMKPLLLFLLFEVISIPTGTIKSAVSFKWRVTTPEFQFLLVRLKAFHGQRNSTNIYISIPTGTIKRRRYCAISLTSLCYFNSYWYD